ncbi:hypothetical protein B0H14DRAFT_2575761 [Mycena olivaceomarginata]|nr:hypothetical protein B0H14DRAFT_2575761 [Mycena olivaceomarginata]
MTNGWGKKKNSNEFRMFQPRVKRSRGDMSGARLNTHSGKKIVSQFGQMEAETEYPSKRIAIRGQREITDAEVNANNLWAAAALNLVSLPLPEPSRELQRDVDEQEEDEPQERYLDVRNLYGIVRHGADGTANGNTDNTLAQSSQADGPNHEAPISTPFIQVDARVPDMISKLGVQVAALSKQGNILLSPDTRMTDIRLRRVERELKSVSTQVSGMKAGISVLLAASEPTVRNSTSGSIQDRVPSAALEHLPNTADVRAPGTTVPIEDIDPSNLRIVLLDGEEFSFDSTQVPNPPNIHFSNDIPRLFKEWESSTLLRRGIAIKDWPMFYQHRKQSCSHKSGAWDKIRTAWGNWKFSRRRAAKIPERRRLLEQVLERRPHAVAIPADSGCLERGLRVM